MDLKKLINFIEKTGDRCIVINDKAEPQYVILSFGAYEKLIENTGNIKELTEDGLLEKINKDVALWKSVQDKAKLEELDVADKEEKKQKKEDNESYYFEPVD
ncbi:type II toxin-antitoxin system Phd/YefM family antitoxin [Candidatus Parcubacteria bacterium]|nr:MAG: type II toxin-antitoxin system Phd/YefM family antitoxin [Candidatus Parcubacteria bacterium]